MLCQLSYSRVKMAPGDGVEPPPSPPLLLRLCAGHRGPDFPLLGLYKVAREESMTRLPPPGAVDGALWPD